MNLTVDLSSVFSGLALAAIIYAAKSVQQLEKTQAVAAEQNRQLNEKIAALENAVAKCRRSNALMRLKFARLMGSAGLDDTDSESEQTDTE